MDLLGNEGFQDGLAASLVVVVPVAVVMVLWRRSTGRASVAPVGGWLAVAVSLVVLSSVADPPGGLASGVVVAGAGGAIAWIARLPLVVRPLAVVPGAIIAVNAVDPPGPQWMSVAAMVAAPIAGAAADEVDRRYRRSGLPLTMLCVTAAGVFVTVPETGLVAPVLGVMVPIGLLAVPWPLAGLGPGAGSAMATLLAALTIDGGWVRPGSVVGGLMAPALFVALAVLPPPRVVVDRVWKRPILGLAILDIAVVLGVTRIAGLRQGAIATLVLGVPIVAIGTVVAARLVTGFKGRPAPVEGSG